MPHLAFAHYTSDSLGRMVVAGVLWLLAFGLFAGKYAPIYWWPRVDGKAR